MKAYQVFLKDEEDLSDIVHAEKPSEAKRKSWLRDRVDNYIVDLRVRRVPFLDDKPLTTQNILKAGFFLVKL